MPQPESNPQSGAKRFPKIAGVLAIGLMLLLGASVKAGDILRGGAPANAARPQSGFGTNPAAAAQARSNAQDALARTSQALNAVKAMQAAARAAAQAGANNLGINPNNPAEVLPNVPDGLAPGGLQFVSATGANAPTQGAGGRGTQVTVKQNVQQALLNWSSFNIGKNTTLNFDQSAGGADAGQWVAFNKVNDPTGRPSQILGSITAQGQVYVINQNGIIFGGTSQVNTHTLVASSLPINPSLIERGLLNNPDLQYLFSALPQPAGPKGPTKGHDPTEGGTIPAPPNGKYGDVTVQPGAFLSAPTSAEHVGGRIALVGANVFNGGTLSTPDGQVILAAGLQVGLEAHKSADPSVRGLDVFVGAVNDLTQPTYAGTVANDGLIEVPRGNATITGRSVIQKGAINSSTSVSLNGSVRLAANYGAVANPAYDAGNSNSNPFLFKSTGNVELGPGSLIQILPELSSTETVVGTQLALRSLVGIQGHMAHFGAGSTLLAPNATVNVDAGEWIFTPSVISPKSDFVTATGQIYLESGAMINVAGSTDIAVPLSQSILTLPLRGAELADSPLQRTSIFRPGDGSNPSITVDLRKTGTYNGVSWVGTPLANLTGYLGLIQRTVGELTVAAGSVKLNTGSSIVMQPGAIVDVSGGFVNVSGGYVKTTRVLYANHIMDIADATPDRLYQGIYTGQFIESHPRWGVTRTYEVPWMLGGHYEQPYIQGADGGSVDLSAAAMALDGDFFGLTVLGPRQRTVSTKPSSISFSFEADQIIAGVSRGPYSPTPPSVTFSEDTSLPPADPFALDAAGNPLPLRSERRAAFIISPELLTSNGFGSLAVNNADGSVTIPRGITLFSAARGATTIDGTSPNGTITLAGSNVAILGSIFAPSGAVSITVTNISQALRNASAGLATPTPDPNRGNFTLGGGASISTAGLVVDDRLSSPAAGRLPVALKGGSVAVNAYNAELSRASVIDVSGGASFDPLGKLNYGDAGSITINAGRDPKLPTVVGGHLKLGGTLMGYSGARGGSLTLQAPLFQIGGFSPRPDVIRLTPEFFNEGGFASFTLNGLGAPGDQPDTFIPAVFIAPGTVIEPVVESLLAVPYGAGPGGASFVHVLKPEGLRTPVSLSFGALGIVDSTLALPLFARGDILFGEGARIRTDAGGSVSFKGDTVAILGSVYAPGGSISVSGAGKLPINPLVPEEARSTVYIGPRSTLSTAGKVVLLPDAFNRRVGTVYPGGSINLSGNILAEEGSVLDVSGTSGVLDVAPSVLNLLNNPLVPLNSGLTAPLYSLATVPFRFDSNGGSITIKGGQGMLVNSTLKGFAGGPTAVGGSLQVSSGRFQASGAGGSPADISLTVTQSKPGTTVSPFGIGVPSPSQGYFTADTFLKGGFDNLVLGGTVEFSGPVDITARGMLSVASGGIIAADSAVHLKAAYARLGLPFVPPLQTVQQPTSPFAIGSDPPNVPPTYGAGIVSVEANLIDVGSLSLQGIGKLNLVARGGDVRGNGTLDVAGDISIRAGQIYPTTLSPFTIAAYDHVSAGMTIPGSVTIIGSGSRDLPLSAGGQLNIYATNIYQGGTVRAPLGVINLGWDGTGTPPLDKIFTSTPFPVSQQVTLAAGSVTSVSAISPVTGKGVLIPYGFSPDGKTWIDPAGADITAGGFPTKSVTVAGQKVTTEVGSMIDIRGGGDVYAYQWIEGNGGSKDILAASNRFAVIPGYDFDYAPYGAFNSTTDTINLAASNPGYVNNSLAVGDKVVLGASAGLPAGTYTLLPARYGLLPGAFLITPQTGAVVGTFRKPDGSSLVAGYSFSSLNSQRSSPGIYQRFEVAPFSVVRSRSEYQDFFGNAFLAEAARKNEQKVPRLPLDAGHLVLQAPLSLNVQGAVTAASISGGRSGLVDISSQQDFVITAPGGSASPGAIHLDSTKLSGYGAESLLIGGVRTIGAEGTTVKVQTNSLTLDNPGAPLSAPEIIFVSNKTLTIGNGASVAQVGTLSGSADTLLIGSSSAPGSGNGTLLRVSSDTAAQIVRSGVTQPSSVNMIIGDNAAISGGSITLDSTRGTQLSPTATLSGRVINLNSGQVSLQLDGLVAVSHNDIGGLVLAGAALQSLQSAQALSLLSYTALDVYGAGSVGSSAFASIALHAAELRGFGIGGGTASINAQSVLIDNSANGAPLAAVPFDGGLVVNAGVITLGVNSVAAKFSNVKLNATGGVMTQGNGSLAAAGGLDVTAPAIAGAKASTYSLVASGPVTMMPSGTVAKIASGLGASMTVDGASIIAGTEMIYPSGALNLRARSGDLVVSGALGAPGTAQSFFDATRFTDAGQITLTSDNGAVDITGTGRVNVSAVLDGGSAGTVILNAPKSNLLINGHLSGDAGSGGTSGVLRVDAGSIPGGLTSSIAGSVSGFNQERSLRDRTDVSVVVDGSNLARTFIISADHGTIQVNGTIDASGPTGGTVRLMAGHNVVLAGGSMVNVAGQSFDAAGKGGAVSLEAGSAVNGANDIAAFVDIQAGSTINLGVTSTNSGSEALGRFQGTLHIRQPQDPGTENLQTVMPINGTILFNPASSPTISVEGYALFSVGGTGTINATVQGNVFNNGVNFMANEPGITAALNLGAFNPGINPSSLVIQPGAEIFNLGGNLLLGAAGSNASSDWDLQTYRFGATNSPGVLTLRASGDVRFYNALSDGFVSWNVSSVTGLPSLYDAWLATRDFSRPANLQSWSYRIAAGVDGSAADFRQVLATGSLLLGKNGGLNLPSGPASGSLAQTSTAVDNRFQVIRTGTGDIDIAAGNDVQLLNQFATIYTAGVQIPDPTLGGTFDVPLPDTTVFSFITDPSLGSTQQGFGGYPPQYAMAGGNVTIAARNDIIHLTLSSVGTPIADSERQLPNNWLYRRSYVDPATGKFGTALFGDIASTTWWVDYSNFFEGIGALGGGNVKLDAGHDVANVDAVIPTNALMPGRDSSFNVTGPDAASLLEFGGGNLSVRAGNNINGGVYYVERGQGVLHAESSILTNATRSPSQTYFAIPNQVLSEKTWLPTTFFVGKGGFDVSARGDVLIGPAVNPFLLPQGFNNSILYKTFFSTFDASSYLSATSLGGSVTLRESVTLPSNGSVGGAASVLKVWMERQHLFSNATATASTFHPWLRLMETSVEPFATVSSLNTPSLRATAFSGDVNIVGDLTIAPSPNGALEILAAGTVAGLQQNGLTTVNSVPTKVFGTARINLSDTNPASVPSMISPLSYQAVFSDPSDWADTNPVFFGSMNQLFNESGSTLGAFAVIQTKQALHAPGILHASDPSPALIYAETGSVSGVTLFSAKATRVIAGGDVSDIALYLQNTKESDISVVSAGRDIVAYNSNTASRVSARALGSALNPRDVPALAGDIQINGPGTLEVLAGRNLDLGTGSNNADGTGIGITSIGNARNPYLPFDGASIVAGAGLGGAGGLDGGSFDFTNFIPQYVTGPEGATYLTELATTYPGLTTSSFATLPEEEQNRIALDVFYLALRDAGRNHSTAGGNYETGFAAITSMFPNPGQGDITTQSRDIRTKSGGSINLLAPGGGLTLQTTNTGSTLAPPGIITEHGGSINIFTNDSVNLGISRIFTLRGGDIMIWASAGDIAAGASSKTVASAPPTRVLIDPQSADVKTDLAGLATGGGIGVLATVAGVAPGNVDLIAPTGVVDAGDAGIRATGNLNIAATAVLNASNIAVGGASSGTPATPVVSAPNVGGLTAAASAAGASNSAAADAMKQNTPAAAQPPAETPSIITVEVLGYGGSDDNDDEERRRRKQL